MAVTERREEVVILVLKVHVVTFAVILNEVEVVEEVDVSFVEVVEMSLVEEVEVSLVEVVEVCLVEEVEVSFVEVVEVVATAVEGNSLEA